MASRRVPFVAAASPPPSHRHASQARLVEFGEVHQALSALLVETVEEETAAVAVISLRYANLLEHGLKSKRHQNIRSTAFSPLKSAANLTPPQSSKWTCCRASEK